MLHFYRFLARRDILGLSRHDEARRPLLRKAVTVVFHVLRALLLFPLFVFFWFLVMSGLLSIILIDKPLLRTSGPIESIQQAVLRLETMIYYLCGVVALELLLRTASGILGLLKSRAARRKSARRMPTNSF